MSEDAERPVLRVELYSGQESCQESAGVVTDNIALHVWRGLRMTTPFLSSNRTLQSIVTNFPNLARGLFPCLTDCGIEQCSCRGAQKLFLEASRVFVLMNVDASRFAAVPITLDNSLTNMSGDHE